MKTALVFGASGQIGAPLLHRLDARGWRVLALSRDVRPDAPGRQWLQGEFARMPGLPESVDAIFSCGPLDAFARWYAQSRIAAPRIVAFGSTSAQVKHDSEDEHERDLVRRLLGAEAELFAASEPRGAAATMLRPTLVYGRGRDATLSRIAALARRHGRFPLPRQANGLRQPVHVDDLADAAFSASQSAAAQGRAYDLPGGETLSYRDMVKRVLDCLESPAKLLELPMPLFRLALRAARSRGIARDLTDAAVQRMREDLVFDAEPAERDFGYAPRVFAPTADMFKPIP